MARLSFTTSVRDGVAAVALEGELDLATVDHVEREIDRLALDEHAGVVVLDLRGLSFLDSSGLRSIIATEARLRGRKVRLVLVKGSTTVQRVFAITRMEERLTFVDDPAAVAP